MRIFAALIGLFFVSSAAAQTTTFPAYVTGKGNSASPLTTQCIPIVDSAGTTTTKLCSGYATAFGAAPTSPAISSLAAATGTNSINNGASAQTWSWNTLAGTNGLSLQSTSTLAASNLQKLLDVELSGTNGTSAQTTYGAYIANTHAGTTSTNVGLYAAASGGTTANYAAIFPLGRVGIGTAAPIDDLSIYDQTSAIATFRVQTTGGSYPVFNLNNDGGSIGMVWNRLPGGGTLYWGQDGDTGGYTFRGTGTFLIKQPVVASGLTTGTSADYLCLDGSNNVIVQVGVCVVSSLRFKKDVDPLTSGAASKVMKLRPVSFRMLPEYQGHRGDVVREGLIAENVAEVDPLLGIKGADGQVQSWDEQGVIALLVKAVQEQRSEIEDMKVPLWRKAWDRLTSIF
jgi:hypothetical protein